MRVLLLLAALLLAACDSGKPLPNRASRKQAAQAAADQQPARHVYRFDSGELHVLDVNTVTGGFADSQKCFLWRDSEFKTASLQCPSSGEMPVVPVTPD
jgi:hypothetical protein